MNHTFISLWKLHLKTRKVEDIKTIRVERHEEVLVIDSEIIQKLAKGLAFIHRPDIMRSRLETLSKSAKTVQISAGFTVLLKHTNRFAFFCKQRGTGERRNARADDQDVPFTHVGNSP